MSSKATINYVLWNENPGGIEKTLMFYPRHLSYYKFSIFILRPKKHDIEMFPEEYFQNKIYGSKNNWKLYLQFFKYALKNRNTIFHVLNVGPVILLILKLAGCRKIIYHIRGTIYWKKNRTKNVTRAIWKIALSKKINLIANSQHSKNVFSKNISKKYFIDVIYNPFIYRDYNSGTIIKDKTELSIFYVGRLVNGKNLFTWLDIANQLKKEFSNISFHFYGKGLLENRLKNYCEDLGIQNNVVFHGFIKNISIAYQSNDVMLFLSEYESFGNVVVESILNGAVVIAKPIPSLIEIFKGFPEFLLTDGNDYKAQVIEKLKEMTFLKEKALQAREVFAEKFSMKKHMNEISNYYERLH